MEPRDQTAAQELAEVKQLQHQQLASRIGVPGLHIEDLQGDLQLIFYTVNSHYSPHMSWECTGPIVSLHNFCTSTGAEDGPGHVIWEAGIVLSHYLVNHPGMDSV